MCKSDATIVADTYAASATGVMNFKQIMKFAFVIAAMHFIVDIAMRWINVMIVEKSCVRLAVLFCLASFAVVGFVKSVLLLAGGKCIELLYKYAIV